MMTPSVADIRRYLRDKYSDDDIDELCSDYFREVYNDFTGAMTKSSKIKLLLDYSERRDFWPNLLAALHASRPDQFEKQFPDSQGVPTVTKHTALEATPNQVFISYAHEDSNIAHQIARDLQNAGYPVWVAPESIRPGEKWVGAIERGLKESGIFTVILTPASIKSAWVQQEIYTAIQRERLGLMQLIPLVKEPCEHPLLLSGYQHISILEDYEKGLSQLLSTIKLMTKKHAKGRTKPVVNNEPKQPSSPRLAEVQIVEGSDIFRCGIQYLRERSCGDVLIYAPTGVWEFDPAKAEWFSVIAGCLANKLGIDPPPGADPVVKTTLGSFVGVYGLPPAPKLKNRAKLVEFAESLNVVEKLFTPFDGLTTAHIHRLKTDTRTVPGTGVIIIDDSALFIGFAVNGRDKVDYGLFFRDQKEITQQVRKWFDNHVMNIVDKRPLQEMSAKNENISVLEAINKIRYKSGLPRRRKKH